MPFRRFGNKYECFFCADEFHLATDLRKHTRTDHVDANLYRSIKFAVTKVGVKLDIADLKCKLCSKDVNNLEILIKHLKEEHDDNCCDETLHYLEYIICFKLSDDEMVCLVCGDTFNFFGPLLLHTHRVHSQRQFICEICGNSFASKSSIVKHTQSVHPTDSYQCRHCDKKFFAVHRRDDHEMRIHDVKARRCHICLEVLGSTHKKTSHLANVHNIWPAEFKCEKCPKKFMHKNLLVKHDKRTHLKEKNVTCDVCGDKFFDNRLLKLHMVRHSDAKPFECAVCGKRFPRKSALEIHTRIHTNDKRCVCKICGKAFVQTASLKLHIRVHHEKPQDIRADNKLLMYQIREKMSNFLTTIIENSTILPFRWHSNKYMCFYCRCPFHESSKLKEHTKTEHRGSNLKSVMRFLLKGDPYAVKLDISEIACKKCPKFLSNLDDFLVHASDAHDLKFDPAPSANLFVFKLSDEEMKCLECDQTFKFFGPLVRHVHKYHNKVNSSFLCDICGQSFVAKANVLSHIKNMHAITECYYDDCDETFRSQYTLRKHLEHVHMKEKLKCPKCPEILGSRYLKKRHLALVHDVKSVQFGCDQCDKIFTLRSKLVSHKQRIHLKEKKVTCEICGFKVYNVDLLKRHMVRHDDSRPFECDICRKAFQRKKTLDYHKRIHTNDRRHVCKECGAAFIQPSSLKLHVRVHHSKVSETGPWT